MSADPTFSNLPLYALPAAVVIALVAIPRAIVAGKKRRAWSAQMERAPGDLRPGPGHFEIETIGNAPTNFGHSSEAKGPSAMPTLDTEAVVVQLCGGPRVRLAAGKKMSAYFIEGATRTQGAAVTTADGIKTSYTFEVPPGAHLHIRASLLAPAGADYRADAVLDLLPAGDSYELMGRAFGTSSTNTEPVVHGILFTFFGLIGGMVVTNAWRGGCNSKGMFPLAVFVDALCIAAVAGAMGLHYGVQRMRPPETTAPSDPGTREDA